jgi:hypothetical protein
LLNFFFWVQNLLGGGGGGIGKKWKDDKKTSQGLKKEEEEKTERRIFPPQQPPPPIFSLVNNMCVLNVIALHLEIAKEGAYPNVVTGKERDLSTKTIGGGGPMRRAFRRSQILLLGTLAITKGLHYLL